MEKLKVLLTSDHGIVPYLVGFIIMYTIIVYIYDVYAFGVRENGYTRKKKDTIRKIDAFVKTTNKYCDAVKSFEFKPEPLLDYTETVFKSLNLYMINLTDILLLCKYDSGYTMSADHEYQFLRIINNFITVDSLIFSESRKLKNLFINKKPKFIQIYDDYMRADHYDIERDLFTKIFEDGIDACVDPYTDDYYKALIMLRNMQDDLNKLCGIYNIDPTHRFRYSGFYVDPAQSEFKDIILKTLKKLEYDNMSHDNLIIGTEDLMNTVSKMDKEVCSLHYLKRILKEMERLVVVTNEPAWFYEFLTEYMDKVNVTYMISIIFGGLYNLHDTDKFGNIIPEKINKLDIHTLINESKEHSEEHDTCKNVYRKFIEYITDFSINHGEFKNETNH